MSGYGYLYCYRVEVKGLGVFIDVGYAYESGQPDQVMLSIFGTTGDTRFILSGKNVDICECYLEIPGFGGEMARWQHHAVAMKCDHPKIQLVVTKRWSGEKVTGYQASVVLNAMKMAESYNSETRNMGARLIRGFNNEIDSSWDYLLE